MKKDKPKRAPSPGGEGRGEGETSRPCKAVARPPQHRAIVDSSQVLTEREQPGLREGSTWKIPLLILSLFLLSAFCFPLFPATVTGNLIDIHLDALETKITFTPTNAVLVSPGGLSAGPPKTITATNGAFATVLDAGDYTVCLPLIPWRKCLSIQVPTGTNTYNITNLISNALFAEDGSQLNIDE